MVSGLSCKDKPKKRDLQIVEQIKGRRVYLRSMYKYINGIEKMDKNDFFMITRWK